MRFGILLLLGLTGLLGFFVGVVDTENEPAMAAGSHRRIVPGVAADSARLPTPFPTPIYDTERWVKVQVRITALELAATGSGTLPVVINATAKAPLPGPLDAPVTVSGQFSVSNEGTDSAGCGWNRVDTNTDFKMTVKYNSAGNLDVLLGFFSPTWHYSVICPAGFTYRSPAFGEEGLELFLRDLMAPYRTNEVANGVRLPTVVISSPTPDCVKRSAQFSSSGIQTRPAEVFVWVYQADWPGGCDPYLPPAELPDPLVPLTP